MTTTTTKIAYAGSTATNLATTALTSLTSGSYWQSPAIDNTTNLYLDVLVRLKTKGQAGSTGTMLVYCYSAIEGTSPAYSDGASGSDGSFTVPTNGMTSKLLGTIQLNGTTAVVSQAFSVAAAFGGILPPKYGIILFNNSGGTLSTTAGDHSLDYQGITATNG